MPRSKLSWHQQFAVASVVAVTACGGSTSDDTTDSVNTGGAWTMNTSTALGGAGTVTTSYLAGGVWTVSTLGSGGSWVVDTAVHTGGIRATGGKPGTTGVTHVGGGTWLSTTVYSSGGTSLLPMGGATWSAGRAISSGGKTGSGGNSSTISAGGAVPIGGTSANGSTPATGGVSALDTDVCMLPAQSGDCLAFFQRFFFNASTGQCELFVYGGCGGNANRFDTLEACQQRCQVGSLCLNVKPPTDQIMQCALNSVCYYDVNNSCGCKLNNGHCDVIDPSCPSLDAGIAADASTDISPPDAGSNIDFGNRAIVCTCGSPAWTCSELVVSWGLD